jgi:hypothetical protein
VALAIAAVGLTLLPASPAGSAIGRIKVCDQNQPGYTKDIDADGDGEFSAGDYSVAIDKLVSPGGVGVGRLATKFFIVRTKGTGEENFDAVFNVDAMFFFPGGKISAYASGRFSEIGQKGGVDFPVTGGTGKYENVTGAVNVRDHRCDGKSGTVFRFHLQQQ